MISKLIHKSFHDIGFSFSFRWGLIFKAALEVINDQYNLQLQNKLIGFSRLHINLEHIIIPNLCVMIHQKTHIFYHKGFT